MAGLYDITPKTLGKGHYGVVKLARHCLTGEPVAIKIIEKDRLNRESLTQIGTEIRILFRLSEYEHPNILKLYQVIDTETKLHLITEFCGPHACDLHDYLIKKQSRSGFPELEAQHIFEQICSAIAYCHSLKIVHRDLKPENILVADQAHNHVTGGPLIKLIDFGFANQWHPGEKMRTSCGTLAYSAPELLLGEIYDGTKVDIWGLGIMLYILLFGNNPFMQINDNETLTKILDCSFTIPERSEVSESAKQLVRALIRRDPERRLLVNQILRHPWLETGVGEGGNRHRLDPKFTACHSATRAGGIKSPLLGASLPSIEEAEPPGGTDVCAGDEDDELCDQWARHDIEHHGENQQPLSLPNPVRSRSSSSDELSSSTSVKIGSTGGQRAHSSSFATATASDVGSQTPTAKIKANTSPSPSGPAIHYRPTSPDINGGEMNDEERLLHESIINEMLAFTSLCNSKSVIEQALKQARMAHRRINGTSLRNNSLSTHDHSGQQSGIGTAKYHKEKLKSGTSHDQHRHQLKNHATNMCNDDYVNATYQLLRDRIIRNTHIQKRQQQQQQQQPSNSNNESASDNSTAGGSVSRKSTLVDPFCDTHINSSSTCAPIMRVDRDNTMSYALPLARKCSLVSEEPLSEGGSSDM